MNELAAIECLKISNKLIMGSDVYMLACSALTRPSSKSLVIMKCVKA